MIKIMKYGEVPASEVFARAVPTVNVADAVADMSEISKSQSNDVEYFLVAGTMKGKILPIL